MPGPARVAQLLCECDIVVSEAQLHEVYEREKWSEERCFTWSEFHELALKCGFDEIEDFDGAVSGAAALCAASDMGPEDLATAGDEAAELAALAGLTCSKKSP